MLIDKLHSVESAFAGTGEKDDQAKWERPSLSGPDRCIRELTYRANGTPAAPHSGRLLNLFDNGIWEEEMVLDRLSRAGIEIVERKVKLATMLGSGEADARVICPDGHFRIVEIKSRSEFVWKREIETPSRDAVTQLVAYIEAAYRLGKIDWPSGLLIGSNRGTAQAYEYLIDYDPVADKASWTICTTRGDRPINGVFEGVIAGQKRKNLEVKAHVAAGTLPPRPYVFGSEYPCSYCRWADTCWAGYKDERGLAVTDAVLEQLDPTLLPLVSEYVRIRGEKGEIEKRHKELGEKIKLALVNLSVKSGKIGDDFKVTLRMQERKAFSVDASTSEVLDIREV
jgi:hypothetical protein